MKRLKNKIIKGGAWLVLAKVCTFLVAFGGGIVLARLLEPAIFGEVALASSISAIGTKLATLGVRPEIMRLNIREEDYGLKLNTLFLLNIIVTIIVCTALIIVIPLTGVVQKTTTILLSIIVVGWGVDNFFLPARALLHQQYRFNTIFVLRIFVPLFSLPVAIIMARFDCGVYSLVVPQAFFLALAGVGAFSFANQSVGLSFSFVIAAKLYRKSVWYITHGLTASASTNIEKLIVGNYLGNSTLGFYNRAFSISRLLQQLLGAPLYTISLPIHSDVNRPEKSKLMFLRLGIKMIIYLFLPLITIFSINCETIIIFVYGPKWKVAANYFVYLAPYAVLWPIYNLLKGKLVGGGNIDYVAKVDVIKLPLLVIMALILVKQYEVLGVCIAITTCTIFATILYFYKIYLDCLSQLYYDLKKPFLFLLLFISIYFVTGSMHVNILTVFIFVWIERGDIKYLLNRN